MSGSGTGDRDEPGRDARILDAVLALLSRHGVSGVSMRAVAREAGVALGLVNYHYRDKVGLIAAALRRVGDQDVAIVAADPHRPPDDDLRAALRRVAAPEYLTTPYLSLRLQLWSLAQTHPDFEAINATAQRRYRSALAALIAAARPDLDATETVRRATDIDVVQNGLWLTALLGLDAAAIDRGVTRCEEIAFG